MKPFRISEGEAASLFGAASVVKGRRAAVKKKREALPENQVESQVLGFLRSRGWLVESQQAGVVVGIGPLLAALDRGQVITRELLYRSMIRQGEKGRCDWVAVRVLVRGIVELADSCARSRSRSRRPARSPHPSNSNTSVAAWRAASSRCGATRWRASCSGMTRCFRENKPRVRAPASHRGTRPAAAPGAMEVAHHGARGPCRSRARAPVDRGGRAICRKQATSPISGSSAAAISRTAAPATRGSASARYAPARSSRSATGHALTLTARHASATQVRGQNRWTAAESAQRWAAFVARSNARFYARIAALESSQTPEVLP